MGRHNLRHTGNYDLRSSAIDCHQNRAHLPFACQSNFEAKSVKIYCNFARLFEVFQHVIFFSGHTLKNR